MTKGRKWGKRIGITLGIVLLILFAVFAPVDRTPYKSMPYYSAMMQQLDSFAAERIAKEGDTLKAGWHKVALTPAELPYPLAGYGIREPAKSVHDTTYVRVFVFDNGRTRVAYISLDLLIFPPALKDRIREQLEGKYKLKCYLTATHTHSAPGGWEPKAAGHFLAGRYHEEYVELLFAAIEQGISKASQQLLPVQYAYVKAEAPEAVRNRLKGDGAPRDTLIRGIKFKNTKDEEAFLFTYAAHANCMNASADFISADYPGAVSKKLEESGWADFVSYGAGAVASHAPAFPDEKDGIQLTDTISDILADKIRKSVSAYSYTTSLYYHRFPLYLRESHLRLQKDIRIRPWVFNAVLGKDQPDIQLLQIGDVLFLGMPCDYSGELMPPLERICESNQKHFILSGFNGGYIGYITTDECYDWERGETMNMNWFGPYNASYLTEVNEKILRKAVQ